MSIRIRLTLWYVALLCLGLVLFAGAVIWQTDRRADDTLDRMLIQRAQDVAADLRFGSSITLRADSPDESSRQLGEAALWIRVLDARGRVAVRQGPPVPGLSSALLSGGQGGLRDQEIAGGLRVRVYTLPVAPHGRHEATVQVITTTRQALDARDRLVAAMGGAGVVVVLVAALGGLFLADRSLRPVDRLTRLAGEIGEGDLHRRVGAEMWAAARRPGRNDELSRLAGTFDAMLGRLRDAGERRRRLTADAAHELCTPVATIASSAEIALRHPREPDEYRATLEHILEESRHMGRVVEDLLLLAQADAGRLPIRRDLVELDEVCRQAVRAFQPLAAERVVTLTALIPPTVVLVVGDDMRLGQVVRNLLDNALRYTPTGGAIRLEVGDATPAGAGRETVTIRVRDTGPGIPPDERTRIFERFHRAAGAPIEEGARVGGSGLGLAISKAIVEAHGGSITLEDGDGENEMPGAHFVVALPGVDA